MLRMATFIQTKPSKPRNVEIEFEQAELPLVWEHPGRSGDCHLRTHFRFIANKRATTSIRRVIDHHWSVRTEFHNHWTTDALKSSFSASSSTTCLGLRVIIGGSFHFP